jgi:hypothetical protein
VVELAPPNKPTVCVGAAEEAPGQGPHQGDQTCRCQDEHSKTRGHGHKNRRLQRSLSRLHSRPHNVPLLSSAGRAKRDPRLLQAVFGRRSSELGPVTRGRLRRHDLALELLEHLGEIRLPSRRELAKDDCAQPLVLREAELRRKIQLQ